MTQAISPLRQRMIDDMRMRKFSPKTQNAYIRAVRRLAAFLGRSPDSASDEDLRRYQLHLVVQGISPISLNATITGLKFFFEFTLGDPERMAKMTPVQVPHKLPVILSREEVARLIESAGSLKYQAALSVAYGAGLRASEVIALKLGDIDSQRMVLRVEQGKGHKDRYAMLPPVLLERLRAWWRYAHAQGKMLKGGWLFPGQNPIDPLRIARQCRTPGASRPRTRTAARRPRRARTATGCGDGSQRRVQLRLPALWCRDDHRRDLRPRRINPCTTHLASCSMITGIGCFNGASALRRLPPIADAIALRCRNLFSRQLRHTSFQPRTVANQHPRDVTRTTGDPITASGRTANHRIPIAA